MSDTLKPINPLLYVKPHDPIPEEVMDSSAWFKTETMELDFGEYVGRPSQFITLHQSDLIAFIMDGWYVEAVLGYKEGGEWKSKARATAMQTGSSQSQAQASSNSQSKASSKSTTKASDSISGFNQDGSYSVIVLGTTSDGSADSSNSGGSSSSGNSHSQGNSETKTEQDGGPYWYSCTTIRLKRRKLEPELVLKDMITDFTKAYNEGRGVNNDRYEELVKLYALMLSRTEDEANAISFSPDDFKPLADMVMNAVKDALEKFGKSVENIPDDWLKSRIDEINRKFDALVSQKRSEMISNGTYNGTVWPSVESGIERDRQYALNNLKDDMVTLKIDSYGKIASLTADVGKKLLDCEIAFINAQREFLLGPTEIRNKAFQAMLSFMERREDDYPALEQLAAVAGSLGYSNGGVGGANT